MILLVKEAWLVTLGPAAEDNSLSQSIPVVFLFSESPKSVMVSEFWLSDSLVQRNDRSTVTEPVLSAVISVTDHRCNPCPETWQWHQDSCYYFMANEEKTWTDSRKDCMDKNSTLAKIDSWEEKVWVKRLSWIHAIKGKTNEAPDARDAKSMHFKWAVIEELSGYPHTFCLCRLNGGSHAHFFLFFPFRTFLNPGHCPLRLSFGWDCHGIIPAETGFGKMALSLPHLCKSLVEAGKWEGRAKRRGIKYSLESWENILRIINLGTKKGMAPAKKGEL